MAKVSQTQNYHNFSLKLTKNEKRDYRIIDLNKLQLLLDLGIQLQILRKE